VGDSDYGQRPRLIRAAGFLSAAAFNVIQLVGWTAVMLIICAGAAEAIAKEYGYSHPILWTILSGQ